MKPGRVTRLPANMAARPAASLTGTREVKHHFKFKPAAGKNNRAL